MSNSVGRIDLDMGINYDAFQGQLSGIAGKATNMVGGAFKRLGAIVAGAFAVGSLVSFGKEAINLASDLQEVENVVSVTFGNMSAEVDAWSNQMLHSFGLSELSAKKYASTMGAMLKSSGLAGAQMKDMSKNLTELAADMASFYNLSTDEAFYKVFAGMTGETEPLKALGVNLSVANMEAFALSQGISRSYQAMSQAEQTLLRYNYLLSVTGDAQGDFARNGDSWANQIRVMTEQWRIFQGTMGQGFINLLTPTIKWINALISRLQVAAQYFRAFTEVLFGAQQVAADSAATATAAATAMGGIGDEATQAAKGIKKAAKAAKGLSALDQFNLIKTTAKDAAGGAEGIASALGGFDVSGMSMGELPAPATDVYRERMQSLVDSIRGQFNGLWQDLKTGWGDTGNGFVTTLSTIGALFAPELSGWTETFQQVFSDIITLGAPLKDWIIQGVVPAWQNGLLVASKMLAGLSDSVRMVFDDIWSAVFPIIQKFVTDGLPRLAEFVIGVQDLFGSLFSVSKQIFDDIWSGAIKPAMDLVSKIIKDALDMVFGWWDEWGNKILSGLGQALDGIKRLWSSLWESFLKPVTQKALKVLSDLWDKHLKGLVQEILKFVGKLATAALDIFNKFVVPIADYLIKTLGPAFSEVFDTVLNVIGSALGGIIDAVKGIIKALGGIVDFIAGVFTGDWKKAWEGIKTFFKGIWDSLVGIVRGVINIIIDLINSMIKGINKFSIDIPDWVATLAGIKGGKFGFSIPEIPKLANGGLVSAPTLAMVGDNRNANVDPEVVTPLSKLQDMLSGNNAISEALLMSILEVLKEIAKKNPTIAIGDTEFGRVVTRAANAYARQNGRLALDV